MNTCKGCGRLRKNWSRRRRAIRDSCYCSDKCHRKNQNYRLSLSQSTWLSVMARDDRACRYCCELAEQVDHIVPYSKGGMHTLNNLVASCVRCNYLAHDRTFESFDAKRNWIQKRIGIHGRKSDESTIDRPAWHKWVYGGQKSLRRP